MESEYINFSVVILAAGKSERMHVPKLGLKYDESMSFVEKIIDTILKIQPAECVLVVNDQGMDWINTNALKIPEKVKITLNDDPDKGRFYSLQCALNALQSKNYVLIVNIDNPFVGEKIINDMLNIREGFEIVIPGFEGRGGHPVIISPKIVDDILSQKTENMRLDEYFKNFSKKIMHTEDGTVLININTPEEYKSTFSNFPKIDLKS